MYVILGNPKSIDDLSGKSSKVNNVAALRSRVNILVIDDNFFAQRDNLKNQNYKIDHVVDLSSWESAGSYNIILCDINGVGKILGAEDGGFLIKELRKHYPQKYLIAYSGQTFNPTHNKYFNQADKIMQKDADLEDWIDKIDELIGAMVDPVVQWRRARNAMILNGIRLELLLHLEDEFVKIIEKGDDLSKWKETKLVSKLEPITKKIIGDLATAILVGKIS